MSEIINIGSVYAVPGYAGTPHPSTARHESAGTISTEDTVEISRFSRTAFDVLGQSSLNLAKIRAIQAEIAEGTFETPDRIRGTLDRLLDVIG
jgi:hypothetical protein